MGDTQVISSEDGHYFAGVMLPRVEDGTMSKTEHVFFLKKQMIRRSKIGGTNGGCQTNCLLVRTQIGPKKDIFRTVMHYNMNADPVP
jgi:hypothetical protein